MNLVAKEFIACQVDEQGVLVLSRFAGAATEIDGAVLINRFKRRRLRRGACATRSPCPPPSARGACAPCARRCARRPSSTGSTRILGRVAALDAESERAERDEPIPRPPAPPPARGGPATPSAPELGR
jgi:hypothetical protein